MPPARKPAARSSATRSRSSASSRSRTKSAPTRREFERAQQRIEKLLGDASDAIQALAKNSARHAPDAYKDLQKTLTGLRRDAQRANKAALKEFDKLRTAVTPAKKTTGSTSGSRSRSTGSRSASRSSGSRTTSARSSASRTASRASSSRGAATKRSRGKS